MKKYQFLFLLVLGFILIASPQAFAKNQNKGNAAKSTSSFLNGWTGNKTENLPGEQKTNQEKFRTKDRLRIKNYISERYKSNCPQGLAKKGNGCLPPGQAKKQYKVGQELGAAVRYAPLPQVLLSQLAPPPAGHDYVMLDNDVLLLSRATHKVVDAITLFSALGK